MSSIVGLTVDRKFIVVVNNSSVYTISCFVNSNHNTQWLTCHCAFVIGYFSKQRVYAAPIDYMIANASSKACVVLIQIMYHFDYRNNMY